MEILAPALALSVVLLGIHAWFGLEIIRRGVIFTDLAIGQMAALGAAVSIVWFGGQGVYPLSLACALGAAALVAVAARGPVNLEAFIGLIYAFGIAGAFLLLSRAAHGQEQFNRALAADILFVPMAEVAWTAILYAALGLVIWRVMRAAQGRWSDAAFYTLFAVTVTSSVRLAGALVVFAILIAPAYIVTAAGARHPLAWAWALGVALNTIAVAMSYLYDLPTGFTVVFVNALAALAVGIITAFRQTGP